MAALRLCAQWGIGSLWVFDMVHVPYGCSVWPSAWVTSSDWPTGGEIDIYEAVNLQKTNQVRNVSSLLRAPGSEEHGVALSTGSSEASCKTNERPLCCLGYRWLSTRLRAARYRTRRLPTGPAL